LKAVVLAAGKGKRLQPLTLTRPKHLLSVGGRPILGHILAAVDSAGIKEALIVVKHMKEKIIEWCSKNNFNLKLEFAEQSDFLGTAHAISVAEDFTRGEAFIVVNGDVLTNPLEIQGIIHTHNSAKPFCTLGVKKVENPYQYGIVSVKNGLVETVIEKPSPSETFSNLISTGIMCFESSVFDIIRQTPLSNRGEYEITTTLKIAISESKKLYPTRSVHGGLISEGRGIF